MSHAEVERQLTTLERMAALSEGYTPDKTFKNLMLEAEYASRGFTLVQKDQLIGIPFVAIAATYRPGFARNGRVGDYVSIEAVVAGPEQLAKLIDTGRIKEDDLSILPDEPVVFNDGSTGVRRAMTELLHERGIISVGPTPDPKEGLLSKYDRPFQFWQDPPDENTTFAAYPDGQPLRFGFVRGLRVSEYPNPANPSDMSQTYYFG